MRVVQRDPMHQDVYADGAVVFTLPSGPIPLGFEISMVDNTGTFAGTNMVVSASGGMLIDGSATLTLSTAYQVRAFKFAGPKWI